MVHAHGDAGLGEVEDVVGGGLAAVSRLEGHGQLAGAGHLEVGGAVLVAVGVAADHDRLRPARHQARHVLDDDGLAEDRSEEHTSELQSLMRISYAVFCLKKKKKSKQPT